MRERPLLSSNHVGSYAVLLWNGGDVRRLRQFESLSYPSMAYVEDIYHKVHSFYRIPYETGIGMQLKFDLDEFCRHFRLNRSMAYYAIKYIEREDHWTVQEDADIPTRVQIIPSREELYDVEIPEQMQQIVLESLMRTYSGLFSYPVQIDEEYIASKAGITVPGLRKVLYGLSLEHIIRYIPADHSSVIYLKEDRLRPKNVHLSPERLEKLKASWQERVDAMTAYATEDDTCRSRFLLKYFGQENTEDCGTCDVCRAASSRPSDTRKALASYIIGEKDGDYTLNDISVKFGSPSSETGGDYIGELRDMIDRGEVPPYKV